jgi:dihydroneopterin aldolase
MSDKITLKNMVFYGFHGVYEFERELGQRFYLDVEITADFSLSSKTDNFHDTVDYVAIYDKTKEIVRNSRFQLMETLVCKIANEVLALSPLILSAKVTVRKPSVPINGALDCIEVECVRNR